MITIQEYGNLLHSDAQCLVNTVNCEGFMGKGIAYQFKQEFPQNNQNYLTQCQNNHFKVGEILFFEEKGKIIANFPTKNKWREKSKYSYIEEGLQALCNGIIQHNITSIAIPQLGCGNGGLEWEKVKEMIYKYLGSLENIHIILYGSSTSQTSPSNAFDMKKANLSHLLLIYFKNHLKPFGAIRLQKAGLFYNIISGTEYFKFQKYKFGPYAHSITVISNQIKSATENKNQDFHALQSSLYQRLVSDSVNTALANAKKVCEILNRFPSALDAEICATLLHIISLHNEISYDEICQEFLQYPKHEIDRFKHTDFLPYLNKLQSLNLIKQNILGYTL